MAFTQGLGSLFQQDNATFDFNIAFEQLFFSIVPSALFIVSSVWRTLYQARKPAIVHAPMIQLLKVGAIGVYCVLELSLLVLATVGPLHVTGLFVAASALKLVSALFMMVLSAVDHSRSPRPSMLLNSYLFLTLLLDAAQTRTLFLSSRGRPELAYAGIFSAAIVLKIGIFLLEARQKSKWIDWDVKEHSPEETSGIFSLGAFFWLNRLFLSGYKSVLEIGDLYPLDSSLSSTSLHEKLSRNMDYSKLNGDSFGLAKVLVRTLRVNLVLPIPPRLAMLGFTLAQPFFTERLLKYLSELPRDPNVGYGLIGASLLIYVGIAVSSALCWYLHRRLLAMARSILITETYLKATKVRLGASDSGAAMTLMSTDIERISLGFLSLHEVWARTIQVALASWLLYQQLGAVFVAPIAVVTACFLGLAVVLKLTGDSQKRWMAGNQKRVGLTSIVISNMKSLKLSGLTSTVSDYVQDLRVQELSAGGRFRKIIIVAALLGFIPLLISPPLTFAFAQRTLDVPRTFTSLSYLLLLTNPLSELFQKVPQIISGLACLSRIQSFLECETREDFRAVVTDQKRFTEQLPEKSAERSTQEPDTRVPPVAIRDGKFGWEVEKFVLRDINIQMAASSLTMIVGPVGSGKSTLCKALLGEIPYNEGSVSLSTRFPHIGFCEQPAFLMNGSVRDNIVGFSPFDEKRYAEVIRVTALSFDLATLPQGDMTNIGSDGITLSGGQKQRVSLARALYLQCGLLILDDVFSGLDADTEEQVFRQVLGPEGLLRRRGATVIFCTHSIKHLPVADYIVVLADGTVAEQGTFNELMGRDGYVRRLGLTGTSESDISSETGSLQPHDESQEQKEEPAASSATARGQLKADESRQVGDKTVYKHYLQSMGIPLAVLCLFFSVFWGVFTNFPTVWLTYWTADATSAHPAHTYAYYAGIYALLQVAALISLLLLGISILIVSVRRAGANVHQEALRTLIRAPLSFFTSTDTGVVTNLFSQDINLVDTELPNALLNTLFCVFQGLGQAAVMLTTSPYLAISYPFVAVILYILQKFYLRTSRQLRLLDLESKSPLYTHFIDTVKGTVTLRAFGYVSEDIQKNARLIDTSQRPAYLLVMIQQWLNLVLDLVVAALAAILTTLAVRLNSNSGFAGASLVTLMSLADNLSGIVIYFTSLETSIGAIARLKTFNETVKAEDKEEEDLVPSEDWPQKGVIEVKGVSASYGTRDDDVDGAPNLALRNLTLTIDSGEKVAVCGRTGSGKSSFIALLLKLLDPVPGQEGGTVFIDDTPLQQINRPVLRQRIIAVPQEAVFLPDGSTFRANLDPTDVAAPGECEAVLEKVGLASFVCDRRGLDAPVNPGTLSAGQRQLMALGRALLRRREKKGGVLLLDEATSSVDHETERVMQGVIRSEFRDYTVVAVSHRLDMIMDFDRVVVMDKGEIVEVGNPMELAAQAGSRFGELIEAAAK
ncbi:putative ABC multidrug transporter [Xylariaceae sp. FL0594]|nr:putative ABC multidrug transporter [Xylariaceae sp. FL0594]